MGAAGGEGIRHHPANAARAGGNGHAQAGKIDGQRGAGTGYHGVFLMFLAACPNKATTGRQSRMFTYVFIALLVLVVLLFAAHVRRHEHLQGGEQHPRVAAGVAAAEEEQVDAVGVLAEGQLADFVVLDADLRVVETWVGGVPVYRAGATA